MFGRIFRGLFGGGNSESGPVLSEAAPRPILFVSSRAPAGDAKASAKAFHAALTKVADAMRAAGVKAGGPPLAINRMFDPKGEWVFDAAIPVTGDAAGAVAGDVQLGTTPSGRVVKAVHVGPYSAMRETYDRIAAFMKTNGLKEGALSWEEYVSDPRDTPAAKLITNIYYQVAP